jgi:hypothetical protein
MHELRDGVRHHSGSRSIFIAFVAVCLCTSSILQLSIATEMMSHARRIVAASRAEPPFGIDVVFPLWRRIAQQPWQLALVVLYAAVAVWAIRNEPARAVWRLVLLWVLISTIFFAGVWLSLLPYRICCI